MNSENSNFSNGLQPLINHYKKYWFIYVLSIFLGLSAAILNMYLSWVHNPQMTIRDHQGSIEWGYWLGKAFFVFIVIQFGISGPWIGILWLKNKLKKNGPHNNAR